MRIPLLDRLLGRRNSGQAEEARRRFRANYVSFLEVLDSNGELLTILSDMEEKLEGSRLFGMSYVRSHSTRALFHLQRMVNGFEALSGKAWPELRAAVARLREQLSQVLLERDGHQSLPYILPYDQVGMTQADAVGGKNAHLGELASAAGAPVPRGFAITVRGFHELLAADGLRDDIRMELRAVDGADPETAVAASKAIHARLAEARPPEAMARAVAEAYDRRIARSGLRPTVAVRSSAVGEDMDLSFAGQYLTELGVTPENILPAYLRVVASLFSPRALIYRLHKGIPFEESAMSVACLEMVDAAAGGVIFSRHVCDGAERLLVNAVPGLGATAVDGVLDPDTYIVSRGQPPRVLSVQAARKPMRLVLRPGGGVDEQPLSEAESEAPCLRNDQAEALATLALGIESHFGEPQDIEWAVDREGRIAILQSRPITARDDDAGLDRPPPDIPGARLLLSGAHTASPGVGAGPVALVDAGTDLAAFPEGAVLVADHSSPNYVLAFPKARAVVARHGSVTGHMATLCREFHVPALVGASALEGLTPGRVVTVDASSGCVFDGAVEELLAREQPRAPRMTGTPVHAALRRAADLIIPLRLTDPRSADFRPDNCSTAHDVMRFIHERTYHEMFKVGDLATDTAGVAVKLQVRLPLDIYVLDLGGGLADEPDGGRRRAVTPAHVTSRPFRALLRGLLDDKVQPVGPRPVDMRGFLSVMTQQALQPGLGAERFGDRSYAIVSDKYLNFSSRVGYHYGIVDCYCGQSLQKNYISFEFKGGAADDMRRARRARSIAVILQRLGFSVETHADRAMSRLTKYPPEEIEARLETLGRLLIFTRQMDMLMTSEASVEAMAECFLKGDFHCDFARLEPPAAGA